MSRSFPLCEVLAAAHKSKGSLTRVGWAQHVACVRRRREQSALNGDKPHVDVWGSETAAVELDDKKVGAGRRADHLWGGARDALAARASCARGMRALTWCACVRGSAQVKEALAKLDRAEKEAVDGEGNKRKYNSLDAGGQNVTPEEMEAWRIKRSRGADDPAANLQAGTKVAGGYELL